MQPGNYSLIISYVGYQTKQINDLQVSPDKITVKNATVKLSGIELGNVEVVNFNKPLFEMDQTFASETVTREEIEKMAVRSVSDVGITSGNGVFSRDDGIYDVNVRGQRSGNSVTFIDGVKVVSSTNLPKSALEEVSISRDQYIKPMFEEIYEQNDRATKRFIDENKRSSSTYIANEVSNKVLNLEYKIQVPYTIPSDGKDYNLKIKETNLPVKFEYFIVPKLDKDAFLIAHINNWEELNLLSGKASVYFKETFTGETYIDVEQAKDTLTLSLGRDKNIVVSREENKNVDDKRFYTNDIKETIAWDIVVKNNKAVPVDITVEDQYPTSNRKSLEVGLLSADGAERVEKTGKLKWSFKLLPQAKKEITFKYEVKYPRYMNLRVK